ncbi:hypothetical protein [Candidiatus Paracoxiella cheracis]|uniref:hypothetical protein n=1 Tax=Candidiatus Paracoxiella cheracis TaxID=3405120 RepID=UPI003BF5EEFE
MKLLPAALALLGLSLPVFALASSSQTVNCPDDSNQQCYTCDQTSCDAFYPKKIDPVDNSGVQDFYFSCSKSSQPPTVTVSTNSKFHQDQQRVKQGCANPNIVSNTTHYQCINNSDRAPLPVGGFITFKVTCPAK